MIGKISTPVRYPEIDALRGIAVCMMVIYHVTVDLSFFGLEGPDPFTGPLHLFGYLTAILFIMISGVGASIKGSRSDIYSWSGIRSFLFRGSELILIGFCITLCTWVFLQGEGYVVYGILHLIGTGIILAPFMMRLGKLIIPAGVFVIMAGWFIPLPTGSLWLAWTGIHPAGFSSVDYTPIIPWLGFFLIAMGTGLRLYSKGSSPFHISDTALFLINPFVIFGRHSLLIYLLHQPILIFVIASAANIPLI